MAAIGLSPTTYPVPNPVKLNGPDPRATVSQTTPHQSPCKKSGNCSFYEQ